MVGLLTISTDLKTEAVRIRKGLEATSWSRQLTVTTGAPPLNGDDDPEALYLTVVLNPDLDTAAADKLYEKIIATSFDLAAQGGAWDMKFRANDHITQKLTKLASQPQ